MKNQVFEYIHDEYGVSPEYLWEKFPTDCIFRNHGTKKWFGVCMVVEKFKLGLAGKDKVDALVVKNDPLLIHGLIDGKGILPGYHMNKQYWLTILLDGTVPFEKICSLVDISFELTKAKKN